MSGRIVVGVGGWTYDPWRETFYPKSVPKKDELTYAASVLTAIEVNGTFYRSQTPATFAKWRASVPDGFVFALKAPRFAVNKPVMVAPVAVDAPVAVASSYRGRGRGRARAAPAAAVAAAAAAAPVEASREHGLVFAPWGAASMLQSLIGGNATRLISA